MNALLQEHTSLEGVRKIGEGTFGEAYKGGGVVFKIVPMEGETLVNGEPQKRAGEIMAEALIALRLSGLRAQKGGAGQGEQSHVLCLAQLVFGGDGRSCPWRKLTATQMCCAPCPLAFVSILCTFDVHHNMFPANGFFTLSCYTHAAPVAAHCSDGFVQTHCVGVCRGVYSPSLLAEWHAWDAVNTSENEVPDVFDEVRAFPNHMRG